MFAFPALARHIERVAVIVLFVIGACASVAAQDPQVWRVSDPIEDHEFGFSVALDGDVAVVGAPNDGDVLQGRFKTGAAYVFRFDGTAWVEEAWLIAPQGQLLDRLGQAVAVDGDFAFVGTRFENSVANNAGAVYVFRHDGGSWSLVQRLTASDGAQGDHFGGAIAVEGEIAVVGAPDHAETGALSGAAYVFRYDGANWVEEAKLTASNAIVQAQFGAGLDVDDGRILIGAFGAQNDDGGNTGAAYLFTHDGSAWLEEAILTAGDGHNLAHFGVSVSLDGDRALVGANLDNELSGGAGAAYLFREEDGGWVEEAKLTASGGAGFFLFGGAVALSGTHAMVGAQNWFPPNGDAPGKAFLFEYDSDAEAWIETAGFEPDSGKAGDRFGFAVDMQGEVFLIGAPERSTEVAGSGTVYSYGEPSGDPGGDPGTVPVETTPGPGAFRLSAAFPNPFRDTARLRLALDRPERTRVRLVDLLGRELRIVYDGMLPAGESRTLEIDAGGLPDGLYLVRVETATHAETRRIVLRR